MLLFVSKDGFKFDGDVWYSMLIVLATVGYGLNANYLARHLKDVPSLNIAAIAFSTLAVPAFFILLFTGYFNASFTDAAFLTNL